MITSEKLNEKWNERSGRDVEDETFSLPENHEDIDVVSRLEANVRRLTQINARINYLLAEVKELIVK
ncbi:MAG: hypothetical protein A4S09_12390 [Proteobacteria bacterium SG_bin7]|nr:MAG: hypothetical protein A4S09_12390 [Proteobacteria bacterium SG_bin7]